MSVTVLTVSAPVSPHADLPRLGCRCPANHCCLLSHGDQTKYLQAPLGHQETMTFDLVHPRCFKGVFLDSLLSVYLFVSAYICLLCFRGGRCIYIGFFPRNYTLILRVTTAELGFVGFGKHSSVLGKRLYFVSSHLL